MKLLQKMNPVIQEQMLLIEGMPLSLPNLYGLTENIPNEFPFPLIFPL